MKQESKPRSYRTDKDGKYRDIIPYIISYHK